MSRLKGADLGPTLLNYRGGWTATPSPAYAVSDTVLRNGTPYVAIGTPGSVDPATGAGTGAATLVQRTSGSFGSPAFTAAVAATSSVLAVFASNNPANNGTPPVAPAGWTLIHDTGVDAILSKRHMYFLAPPGTVSGTGIGFTNSSGTWIGLAFEFAGTVAVSFAREVDLTGTSGTISATNPAASYVVVTTGSGTTGNVSNGALSLLTNDGGSTPDTFWSQTGGAPVNPSYAFTQAVSAGFFASMAMVQTPAWTPLAPVVAAANSVTASGAATTLPDVTTATVHSVTLTANCTLTFPAAAVGKSFTLALKQDATGSRTVTWPTTVKWAGGTAPTLTTTASKTDVLSFVCIDGTNWLGRVVGLNY